MSTPYPEGVTPDLSDARSACLVCQELNGEVSLPGGLLAQDDYVAAFHVPPLQAPGAARPYLGHLLVVTRRHVPDIGSMSDEEASSVGKVSARLARALTQAVGASRVYVAVVGTGVAHFHQHVFPRYPSTPDSVAWHAVDEWEGAEHGNAEQVLEVVTRLRRSLER